LPGENDLPEAIGLQRGQDLLLSWDQTVAIGKELRRKAREQILASSGRSPKWGFEGHSEPRYGQCPFKAGSGRGTFAHGREVGIVDRAGIRIAGCGQVCCSDLGPLLDRHRFESIHHRQEDGPLQELMLFLGRRQEDKMQS